jgi:hypothetical protein
MPPYSAFAFAFAGMELTNALPQSQYRSPVKRPAHRHSHLEAEIVSLEIKIDTRR